MINQALALATGAYLYPKGPHMPNYPEPAKVAPHTWARGSSHELDGAIVYVGRRDIFIPATDLPDIITRLQAITDATN